MPDEPEEGRQHFDRHVFVVNDQDFCHEVT
jgi:hypothetical protein